MLLSEILARNARMYPRDTALVERTPREGTRRVITWRDFDRQASRVASALAARGIAPGDRVAMQLGNCLEWLPVYFGILRAGAWAVPLNYRFPAPEVRHCLEVSQARAVVFGPEYTARVGSIRDRLPAVKTFVAVEPEPPAWALPYGALLGEGCDEAPEVPVSLEDPAALYFTSGTTGRPKPILLTHGNLFSACVTENRHHLQTRQDTFICIPPLYHTGAKMHWFGSFVVGAPGVILRGVEPEAILEAVSEEGGTIVWLLVPWAQDILDAVEAGRVRLADYRLEQWRLMHIGAQPVPPSLVRRWLEHFPGHQYDTNYGLTEATGPGCVHLGTENLHKVGAIGRAGFDWETRVAGPDGRPVPRGEVGELLVRGPGVMREYYRNPEATAEVLRQGWLHTGDMAREDEDGFLYLVDRKKDLIISGGENIYPVEVEDFLREHQAVRDAAVIGLPDRRLGEVPVAVVDLRPGFEVPEEALLAYCAGLPRYKRPCKIFLGEVPRNPTGKIEKPVLRRRYGAEEVAP
jgi:acyl-CoA synthetase (AMP-forming)/AMP-acid ligase II